MKSKYSFFFLMLVMAGTKLGGQQSARVADLDPGLQQALAHDAACEKTTGASADDKSSPLPDSPVVTEDIRAGGREAGVIAAPQDACHCNNANCKTYVYLKSGDSYRLALEETFASLRPMKIIKHGMPSLSGKFQVNDMQEETTVFDWNGQAYEPSLCATVTRFKNQKLPRIVKHECRAQSRKAEKP